MISTLCGGSSAWPSAGSQSANSASSAGNLAQLQTQLFASIDTNGNGSISQSELANFMNTLTGTSQGASASAGSLFNSMDTRGGSGISLQDFQNNIGTFVSALRSQLAVTGSTSPISTAASATGSGQHRHHGDGHGGGGVTALLAALQQATSGASGTATSSSPTATLNAVA